MRTLLAAAAAVLIALPLTASADEAANLKKQVEANHVKSMKSFAKGDVKGMMVYIADDYSGTNMMGQKQTKADVEKEMAGYMKETKKVNSSSYTVSDVKVNGSKASGKSVLKLDAVVIDNQGMMGPKGKTHRMKMEQPYTVTWKKSGGNWLVTSETPAGMPKMEIDGKAMSAQATPQTPKK